MANFTPGAGAPDPNSFGSGLATPKTDPNFNSFYAGMGIQPPSSTPVSSPIRSGANNPAPAGYDNGFTFVDPTTPGKPLSGNPASNQGYSPSGTPTGGTGGQPNPDVNWNPSTGWLPGGMASNIPTGTPTVPAPAPAPTTTAPAGPAPAWRPFDPNVSNVQVTQPTGAPGATGNYSYNGNDYSTSATATRLADLLGGKVVTNPNSGSSSPQYMIQLPNGSYINAGEASAVANANGGTNNAMFQNYFGPNGSMLASSLGGSTGPAYNSSATAVNPVSAPHSGILDTSTQNPSSNSGGIDYSGLMQLLSLGGGGTSNAFGNAFNPSISQSSSPSFYGQATTSPLNSTTNIGVGNNPVNNQMSQMNMLLAFLLSGGNTAALSH